MSEHAIYVLGVGGHGHVVLDALRSSGLCAAGIIDPALIGTSVSGVPVLGGDEVLASLDHHVSRLVLGVGANPDTTRRTLLFRNAKQSGWNFTMVSHPSALLGENCDLGEGCQRMAGSIVQPRVRLGVNVVVNTGSVIDHDCVIGDHSFISPGVTMCGNVTLGAESFIGAGSVIVPGVTIGRGVVVGAGAVVLNDIESGEVAVGNPARTRKRRSHV
jgi:UDP-perosamine 4-acetyltransferase